MMSAFALAWVGLGAGVAVCDASDGLAVVWLPPGLAQATLVNVNKMTVTRRFIARVTERAEAGYKRCSKACGYCPTGVGEYEREPRWFPLIGRSLRDGPALFPEYGLDLSK